MRILIRDDNLEVDEYVKEKLDGYNNPQASTEAIGRLMSVLADKDVLSSEEVTQICGDFSPSTFVDEYK